METKTNVVLVHGAWVDGSSWSKVIPLLQKRGLNVVAAQLKLSSAEDDIAVTRNLMATLKGPMVLVGHSYGGIIITGAAENQPDVRALVYIAAFALEEGETTDDVGKHGPPPAGFAQVRPDERGFLWLDREGFPQAVAADVSLDEARVAAAVQTPVSVKALSAKGGRATWKNIPSWYLVPTQDQMISPQVEEFMAKRMKATTRSVPASHAVIVSRPNDVAELIALAAESVEKAAVGAAQ